ncbi:MAG TPA: tetratricopeptide repeat protein, partial [Candidatus Binataceae bacterium]|nr:tetratricopeptide repeat protein [Candidatus Binataceae bacterium]
GVANTTFLDAQALNFAVPARAVLALAPLVPRTVANWHRRNWKPDAAGWYDAGYAAWYIGDAARADGYFASAARRDPRLAEAWWGRGVCAEQLGKPALARAYLEQAVALKPRFALAHYDLARVESELGRSAEAARERALAARLDPKLAASQAHSSAHRLPH